MKEEYSRYSGMLRKGRAEETGTEYWLSCDFGYDITSPIPSVEPVHRNSHCVVPAAAGTAVKLFPGEWNEIAEFVSLITDEDGRTAGMRCRIRRDPKLIRILGLPDDPVWEGELICGKAVMADENAYENGKNTYTYHRLLLTDHLE